MTASSVSVNAPAHVSCHGASLRMLMHSLEAYKALAIVGTVGPLSPESVGTPGMSVRGRTLDRTPKGNCMRMGTMPTAGAGAPSASHRSVLAGILHRSSTAHSPPTGVPTHGLATSTGS